MLRSLNTCSQGLGLKLWSRPLAKSARRVFSNSLYLHAKRQKESQGVVISRGSTRVALLRLDFRYSVVPLRSGHKPIPYEDRKESRGVVTSRERTRVALLRLAFRYSVLPLRSGHKPIP